MKDNNIPEYVDTDFIMQMLEPPESTVSKYYNSKIILKLRILHT